MSAITKTAKTDSKVSSRNHLEGCVPRLRFPGFKGEWSTAPLRHFFTKSKSRNKDFRVNNVITNSAEYGLVAQSEFFDKDIAIEENTESYYIIHKGDFVYNPRKSKAAPFGPFNRYEKIEDGIVSPLYTCLNPLSNINNDYLAWYFRGSVWHRYVYDNGSQGARHDRVNMTDDLLFGIPIRYPQSKEQAHIADFLFTLESRIIAQRRLVELLKKHKRGLIRSVFSRKLSTGEKWYKYRLDEIAEVNPSTINLPDKFLYIDLESVSDGVWHEKKIIQKSDAPSRAQRVVSVGDILFQMVRPYQQNNLHISTSSELPVVASTGYAQIRTNQNSSFLYWLLHSPEFLKKVLVRCTGSSYPAINSTDLKEIYISIPSIESQNRYAQILNDISQKCIAEELVISKLETLKNGLLQQLFI